MPHGRRSLLKRELKRSIANLDKYMGHMRNAVEKIDGDNQELENSFLVLARAALFLQAKTEALNERI